MFNCCKQLMWVVKQAIDNEPKIIPLKKNLEVQMTRNESLEKENKDLRQEVARLKSQIMSLKAHNIERISMLWKKIQKSMDGNSLDALQQKAAVKVAMLEKSPTKEKVHTNSDLQETPKIKDRSVKVPPPPPRPSSNPLLPSHKSEKGVKVQPLPMPTTAPPPPMPASNPLLPLHKNEEGMRLQPLSMLQQQQHHHLQHHQNP
ncbi:hypothetical protein JHK86_049372 [Glycine max]|nr:hypothetical protein JHK86_049372 [Glycine max]